MPLSAAFKIESRTMRIPQKERGKKAEEYREHVLGLVNGVSKWLGFGDDVCALDPAGRKALTDEVKRVDEKELFRKLSVLFHKDLFHAAYERGRQLIASIEDDRFNCYGSTALMAQVLTILGKPFKFVWTPKHIFLRGEHWAFETTVIDEQQAIFSTNNLGQHHQKWQESSRDSILLSEAYEWCGRKLSSMGRYSQALSAHKKAIRLDPNNAKAWDSKGIILDKMGKTEKALTAFEKLNKTGPGGCGCVGP